MPPKIKKPITMQISINSLPPGIVTTEQFGSLIIKMGKVQWIQDANPHWGNLHYRLKFWGQEGDGHLLKPINSSSNVESEIAFQILSPISGFHLYLRDMEKLKIYLVDPDDSLNKIFGHITLNFERHLNKDLSRNNIFHNISGLYPIFKYFPEQKENQDYRMGYQQIDVDCNFVLLKQQIDICKKLNQMNSIEYLQQLLKKNQQHYPPQSNEIATQMPQCKVEFPNQKEEWMEQSPDTKIANTLFANNPFAPKQQPITNPYERDKYLGENNKQQYFLEKDQFYDRGEQVETIKVSNQDNNNWQYEQQQQQYQQQQQQYNLNQQQNQINERDNDRMNYHCMNCCPHKQSKSQKSDNHESPERDSSNRKELVPFRHTKPGSGNYSNTPTGHKYMNKPDQNRKPKLSPYKFQSKSKDKQIESASKSELIQVAFPMETKSIQTMELRKEEIQKSAPQTEQRQLLENFQKLKIELIDFHGSNKKILDKLNAINIKNMFLDCNYKNTSKRVFFKGQGQELYSINEELDFDLAMNEVQFGNTEELKFILQCYRKPDNSEDQKYFKMILGEGTFSMVKALNPDEYYVLLETNLPFERETSNQQLQFSVVNKEQLTEYQHQVNRLGEIRIRAKFVRKENQQEIELPFFQQYHSYNPTLLIRFKKITGVHDCSCRFKIPATNDFFSSQLLEPYQIIIPLNYESFERIKQSPLIVEIWQAKDLVGIVRLSLKSIYEILGDELNSQVFKNTYPLIIIDEMEPIKKLKDQQQIGELGVLIAFGTPSQIYRLKIETPIIQHNNNHDVSIQIEQEQINKEQIIPEQEQVIELTFMEKYRLSQYKNSSSEYFIKLFELMGMNQELLIRNENKFIPIEDFEKFNLDELQNDIFQIMKVLDYKQQDCVRKEDLYQSYNSYCQHLPRVSIEISKLMKQLMQNQWKSIDPLEAVAQLLQQSNLGLMEIDSFNVLLPDSIQLQYILLNQNNQVSIRKLNEFVCQYIAYGHIKLDQIKSNYLHYQIQNYIKVDSITIIEEINEQLTIHDVQNMFQQFKIQLSFWEVYSLFQYIKQINKIIDIPEWLLSSDLLIDWINQKQQEQQLQNYQNKPKIVVDTKKDQQNDSISDFRLIDKENEQNNINNSNKHSFYIHKFRINLKELQNLKLPVAFGTQIEMEFHYPLCEQTVRSYPLIYSKNTQYQIPSESSYTYIQQREGENSKNIDVVDCVDGGIQFKLKADQQLLAQSLLSSNELSNWMDKSDKFKRDKTLMLLPVNGKFSFAIEYERIEIQNEELLADASLLEKHNQTAQQVHLPKMVQLQVYAEISINEKMLKYQDKVIKAEIFSLANFEIQIPRQSRNLIINEETPLKVDGEFLQRLQTQPLIIQISTDQVLGKCELSQTNLLRNGIDGDFALTNENGMFVGFAKLKCRLNKVKMPIPQQIDEDMPKMQCVILFRELLIDFKKLLKNDQQDVYIYFGIKQNNRTEFSEINLIQKTNVLANINCSIKLELMFHEELTVILYQTNKKTINQIKDVKLGEMGIRLNQLTQSQKQNKGLVINEYFTLNCDADIPRVGLKIVLLQTGDDESQKFINLLTKGESIPSQLVTRYVGTQGALLNSEFIWQHLNRQNFVLKSSQWTLIEELSKLSEQGYLQEEKIQKILSRHQISNFSEKSYSLFNKQSLLDKYAQQYLNYFDAQVFMSKIGIVKERQSYSFTIEIMKAYNLHLLNNNKSPNSTIETVINGETFKTPIRIQEKHPKYEYCFYPILEENVNLEFKVHNSGTDQVLGVAYINSSELIKCYKEGVSQELKIYIHGSKAQSYVQLRVNCNEVLQTLKEVENMVIADDLDLERIRDIIAQI